MSNTAPYFLPSNQFDHFYRGGDRIGALRNGPGGPMRPEEWIGSSTTRFGEKSSGLSTLPTGTLLRDAIENDPQGWLGADLVAHSGSSSEILVKLLDPAQRLPVHFHPNKAFAKKHLALNHGKTEAWIILEAPEGARVGLGFKETMSKQSVNEMVSARDSKGLLDSLDRFEVHSGDTVLVPAGVPHAIDSGIFVLELQEPTDLSALLEWEGFAVDGEKDGHLGVGFDTVLDALRYTPVDDKSLLLTSPGLTGGEQRSLLATSADGYFRADLLPGSGEVSPSFTVVLVLENEGVLKTVQGDQLAVTRGDALVIPFNSGGFSLSGATAVACRPPLPSLAELSE